MKVERKYFLIMALLAALIIPAGYIVASDISDADYSGTVRATNNGTATENVSAVFTANTTAWIDSDILNSSANNCAVRINGVDVAFGPGYSNPTVTRPWAVWFSSVPANGSKDATLYTGNVTGGKSRYFPGAAGMSIDDFDIVTDNGSIGVSGRLDGSGNITLKDNAVTITYDETTSNVTAKVAVYPTAASDPTTWWADETKSYDGDNSTFAYSNLHTGGGLDGLSRL